MVPFQEFGTIENGRDPWIPELQTVREMEGLLYHEYHLPTAL